MMAGQSNGTVHLSTSLRKWGKCSFCDKYDMLKSRYFTPCFLLILVYLYEKEFSKRNAGRPGGLYPQLVQYFVSKAVVGVPAATLNGISSGSKSIQCKAMRWRVNWICPVFLNMSFSLNQPVRGIPDGGVDTLLFGVVTAALCWCYWAASSSLILWGAVGSFFWTALCGFHTRSEKTKLLRKCSVLYCM